MKSLLNITIAIAIFLAANSKSNAREVIPFNKGWQFKKGPFSNEPAVAKSLFEGVWETVTLPHTWNAADMQTRKNEFYEGSAYYKKQLTVPNNYADKRVYIRFEGVGQQADLYVNGTLIGRHRGGYSAFAFEIGRALKIGKENEIVVKVDNSANKQVIPVNHSLFGVYGGIYRPVWLIVTDKINIAVTDNASPGVYIKQKDVSSKGAEVEVSVKLENRNLQAKPILLRNEIFDMAGKKIMEAATPLSISPQGRQTIRQTIHIDKPHLWQGRKDPYLYKVVSTIIDGGEAIDSVVQPLGLRTFGFEPGKGFLLNGEPYRLYGVCRHQDWWAKGSALSNAEHKYDLETIYELGATSIRFAHYQQSEYVYAKCDSLGFVIWAEIPFVNQPSTEETDNAKSQLTELIRQNYNHPSIYTWGLHNEVYKPTDYTYSLTASLHDLAKSEDPDRFTVAVNGYGEMEHPVNLAADIQGINRYFGWYEGKIGDLEPWIEGLEKNYTNHRVILAEYGAEANTDHQQEQVDDVADPFAQFFPESYQTKFHEVQWGIIEKHPYLMASYVWNTFDFAVPAWSNGGVPARNMKGLVTFDRKIKKDAFYWYKANWSTEPVVYITQRRCSIRRNKITNVTVYSNVGVPTIWINGRKYTSPSTGNTRVHYIFKNVTLQKGSNIIKASAGRKDANFSDQIEWRYLPSQKEKDSTNEAHVRKEHGGFEQ